MDISAEHGKVELVKVLVLCGVVMRLLVLVCLALSATLLSCPGTRI